MKTKPQFSVEVLQKLFNVPNIMKQFAGAGSIVNNLISNQSCLTTESAKDIWIGGIGNFLTFSDIPDGVGIVHLELELDSLLKSKLYHDTCKAYKKEVESNILRLEASIEAEKAKLLTL